MQMATSVETDNGEMIVKRVSVPIGLEEMMEGLTKEVMLKKPKDIYVFASEYFANLLDLREKGSLKGITGKRAQSVTKQLSPDGLTKLKKKSKSVDPVRQLSRQTSIRSESPIKKTISTKKIVLVPKDDKNDKAKSFLDKRKARKGSKDNNLTNQKIREQVDTGDKNEKKTPNLRERSVSNSRPTKNDEGTTKTPRQRSLVSSKHDKNSNKKSAQKNEKSGNLNKGKIGEVLKSTIEGKNDDAEREMKKPSDGGENAKDYQNGKILGDVEEINILSSKTYEDEEKKSDVCIGCALKNDGALDMVMKPLKEDKSISDNDKMNKKENESTENITNDNENQEVKETSDEIHGTDEVDLTNKMEEETKQNSDNNKTKESEISENLVSSDMSKEKTIEDDELVEKKLTGENPVDEEGVQKLSLGTLDFIKNERLKIMEDNRGIKNEAEVSMENTEENVEMNKNEETQQPNFEKEIREMKFEGENIEKEPKNAEVDKEAHINSEEMETNLKNKLNEIKEEKENVDENLSKIELNEITDAKSDGKMSESAEKEAKEEKENIDEHSDKSEKNKDDKIMIEENKINEIHQLTSDSNGSMEENKIKAAENNDNENTKLEEINEDLKDKNLIKSIDKENDKTGTSSDVTRTKIVENEKTEDDDLKDNDSKEIITNENRFENSVKTKVADFLQNEREYETRRKDIIKNGIKEDVKVTDFLQNERENEIRAKSKNGIKEDISKNRQTTDGKKTKDNSTIKKNRAKSLSEEQLKNKEMTTNKEDRKAKRVKSVDMNRKNSLTKSLSSKTKILSNKSDESQDEDNSKTKTNLEDKNKKRAKRSISVDVGKDNQEKFKPPQRKSFESAKLREELKQAEELSRTTHFKSSFNPFKLKQEIKQASQESKVEEITEMGKIARDIASAIKIQSLWRGFNVRKNNSKIIRQSKLTEEDIEKHLLTAAEIEKEKSEEVREKEEKINETNKDHIDSNIKDGTIDTNESKIKEEIVETDKEKLEEKVKEGTHEENEGGVETKVNEDKLEANLRKEADETDNNELLAKEKVVVKEKIDEINKGKIETNVKDENTEVNENEIQGKINEKSNEISKDTVDAKTKEETVEMKPADNKDKEEKGVPDLRLVDAVLKIQALWRGFKVRKHLKQGELFGSAVKKQKENKESLEVIKKMNKKRAVSKIQALWRGYKVRKNIKQVNKRLEELQKPSECDEMSHQRGPSNEDIFKAASKIQAGVRGYMVRKKRSNYLNSIIEETPEEKLSDEQVLEAIGRLQDVPDDSPKKSEKSHSSDYDKNASIAMNEKKDEHICLEPFDVNTSVTSVNNNSGKLNNSNLCVDAGEDSIIKNVSDETTGNQASKNTIIVETKEDNKKNQNQTEFITSELNSSTTNKLSNSVTSSIIDYSISTSNVNTEEASSIHFPVESNYEEAPTRPVTSKIIKQPPNNQTQMTDKTETINQNKQTLDEDNQTKFAEQHENMLNTVVDNQHTAENALKSDAIEHETLIQKEHFPSLESTTSVDSVVTVIPKTEEIDAEINVSDQLKEKSHNESDMFQSKHEIEETDNLKQNEHKNEIDDKKINEVENKIIENVEAEMENKQKIQTEHVEKIEKAHKSETESQESSNMSDTSKMDINHQTEMVTVNDETQNKKLEDESEKLISEDKLKEEPIKSKIPGVGTNQTDVHESQRKNEESSKADDSKTEDVKEKTTELTVAAAIIEQNKLDDQDKKVELTLPQSHISDLKENEITTTEERKKGDEGNKGELIENKEIDEVVTKKEIPQSESINKLHKTESEENEEKSISDNTEIKLEAETTEMKNKENEENKLLVKDEQLEGKRLEDLSLNENLNTVAHSQTLEEEEKSEIDKNIKSEAKMESPIDIQQIEQRLSGQNETTNGSINSSNLSVIHEESEKMESTDAINDKVEVKEKDESLANDKLLENKIQSNIPENVSNLLQETEKIDEKLNSEGISEETKTTSIPEMKSEIIKTDEENLKILDKNKQNKENVKNKSEFETETGKLTEETEKLEDMETSDYNAKDEGKVEASIKDTDVKLTEGTEKLKDVETSDDKTKVEGKIEATIENADVKLTEGTEKLKDAETSDDKIKDEGKVEASIEHADVKLTEGTEKLKGVETSDNKAKDEEKVETSIEDTDAKLTEGTEKLKDVETSDDKTKDEGKVEASIEHADVKLTEGTGKLKDMETFDNKTKDEGKVETSIKDTDVKLTEGTEKLKDMETPNNKTKDEGKVEASIKDTDVKLTEGTEKLKYVETSDNNAKDDGKVEASIKDTDVKLTEGTEKLKDMETFDNKTKVEGKIEASIENADVKLTEGTEKLKDMETFDNKTKVEGKIEASIENADVKLTEGTEKLKDMETFDNKTKVEGKIEASIENADVKLTEGTEKLKDVETSDNKTKSERKVEESIEDAGVEEKVEKENKTAVQSINTSELVQKSEKTDHAEKDNRIKAESLENEEIKNEERKIETEEIMPKSTIKKESIAENANVSELPQKFNENEKLEKESKLGDTSTLKIKTEEKEHEADDKKLTVETNTDQVAKENILVKEHIPNNENVKPNEINATNVQDHEVIAKPANHAKIEKQEENENQKTQKTSSQANGEFENEISVITPLNSEETKKEKFDENKSEADTTHKESMSQSRVASVEENSSIRTDDDNENSLNTENEESISPIKVEMIPKSSEKKISDLEENGKIQSAKNNDGKFDISNLRKEIESFNTDSETSNLTTTDQTASKSSEDENNKWDKSMLQNEINKSDQQFQEMMAKNQTVSAKSDMKNNKNNTVINSTEKTNPDVNPSLLDTGENNKLNVSQLNEEIKTHFEEGLSEELKPDSETEKDDFSSIHIPLRELSDIREEDADIKSTTSSTEDLRDEKLNHEEIKENLENVKDKDEKSKETDTRKEETVLVNLENGEIEQRTAKEPLNERTIITESKSQNQEIKRQSPTQITISQKETSQKSGGTTINLVHSGEFHDTITVPISVSPPAKTSSAEEDRRSSPQGLVNTGELHDNVLPLSVHLNEAPPAGAEVLTSHLSKSISSGGQDRAQASNKDASTCETQPDNTTPSSASMETEKRNNASIQKKSMEVEAATKIQAGFRGYQVRKQLKNKISAPGDISNQRRSARRKSSGRMTDSGRMTQNKTKSPSDIEEKSAVKIQAGVRGFLVRRRQKKQKQVKESS